VSLVQGAGQPVGDDDRARAREASSRSEWSDAFALLTRVDSSSPLGPADLELLATAAYLVGRVRDCLGALERAYRLHADHGDSRSAVRCAFWLCFHHFNSGEFGQGGGWLAKAGRLAERVPERCAERAYLLLPVAFEQVAVAGQYAVGRATATTALDIARGCGETDAVALALNLVGRSFLREGRVAEGLTALDEAMVEVVTGAVSAPVAGAVYCSLIEACEEISELRRAREWTDALSQWCDGQRGMVTFTGQCLVHRATIKQLHGDWVDALEEVRLACERFGVAADVHASGLAMYRLGELHRLRGEDEDAEQAYRQAADRGHDPQPGLALLRLAQGKTDVAVAAIRRAVDECRDRAMRAKLLVAFIEITLVSGDLEAARSAVEELAATAAAYGTPVLAAVSDQARGAALLADGDARGALTALREAQQRWREFDMPYDEARVRVLIAHACDSLGDDETASFEREAARRAFERLGAGPDVARLRTDTTPAAGPTTYGLSRRELEVLRLVATGTTNQAIAKELCLAVKTVDRHVSNILTKLGVRSRAAATAFAYQHGLS
jgi:DNA-binding CsgD family transcriptional regulator/tetratricopeptide (TPR) repeat protein